jgi:hypothetical protein
MGNRIPTPQAMDKMGNKIPFSPTNPIDFSGGKDNANLPKYNEDVTYKSPKAGNTKTEKGTDFYTKDLYGLLV